MPAPAAPPLAALSLDVPAGTGAVPARLTFDLAVPGADWSVAARRGAPLSVFVDGKLHSDLLGMAERSHYAVNLGVLAPGAHTVELRDASLRLPDPVVTAASAALATGDQALFDRHAPVIVARQMTREPTTDAPLALAPAVTRHADGTRTLTYNALFSNEDGGTATDKLMSRWGRTTDYEWVYRLRVDANGNAIPGTAEYQGAGHKVQPFRGQRVGDQPLLRVATTNNNFTDKVPVAASQWSASSDAGLLNVRSGLRATAATEGAFLVMARELAREGKIRAGAASATGEPGVAPVQVADPRRYLYLGSSAPGTLQLGLADGSTRALVVKADGLAPHDTAIELPRDLSADAITGIQTPDGRFAAVLDAAYAPRLLAAG